MNVFKNYRIKRLFTLKSPKRFFFQKIINKFKFFKEFRDRQDFGLGIKAELNHDIEEAKQHYLKAIKKGDVSSMINLGNKYLKKRKYFSKK
jgi:hypothetical protein